MGPRISTTPACQKRTRYTDAQWRPDDYSLGASLRPSYLPDESRANTTQPSSLHESMLRSQADSTSQWATRSSLSPEDARSARLFQMANSDQPKAQFTSRDDSRAKKSFRMIKRGLEDSQGIATTQHISIADDGLITHEVINHAKPGSPSITTKFLPGNDSIEIVRQTHNSPGKSAEVQDISTIENLREMSEGTPPSTAALQDSEGTPPQIKYTTWNIPNDRFKDSTRPRNVKFFGLPVDTSTPTNVQRGEPSIIILFSFAFSTCFSAPDPHFSVLFRSRARKDITTTVAVCAPNGRIYRSSSSLCQHPAG